MELASIANPAAFAVSESYLADEDVMSEWANKQYLDKYSWKDDTGEPQEVWPDTAYRVVRHVLGALNYTDHDPEFQDLVRLITDRKFLPGGRYLANAGKSKHFINNCLLYRCADSISDDDGWADLVSKCIKALSSGGGVGVVYSDVRGYGSLIKATGNMATGPLSPACMVNEVARHVKAGSRRSAIWGGLHWWHPDIFRWIEAKDWSEEIKAQKTADYNFPAPLDMTNISVILDSSFFTAYNNERHPQHELAHKVYWTATEHMLRHGEPGFSINVGQDDGEDLRNAPVTGDTHVLTDDGYQPVQDLVGRPVTVWTGEHWAENVTFQKTQDDAPILAVEMTGGRVIRCEPTHEFLVERYEGLGVRRQLISIDRVAAQDLWPGDQIHVSYPEMQVPGDLNEQAYTLGWIYGDGSFTQAGGADLTLCSEESKACRPHLTGVSSVTDEDSRGYTRMYFGVDEYWRGRSKSRFPVEYFGAALSSGLPSFIAGLFDADGNWEPKQKRIRLASKHEAFLRDVARALEQLGILAHVTKSGYSTYGQTQGYQLVIASSYTKRFAEIIPTQRIKPRPELVSYTSYRASAIKVMSVFEDGIEDVYCADVQLDEHSFMAEGVIIANCTEITSADDSDVCNLGSINLARIESKEELADAVRLSTLFLLAGTVYSDVPHEEVRLTRDKNRRIGLGLMGVHEWLIARGYDYEVVPELEDWLEIYRDESDKWAVTYADKHGLSHPIKKRAIAPNGCQEPTTMVVTDGGILELQELGEIAGDLWQKVDLRVAQERGQSRESNQFYVNGEAATKRLSLRSGIVMEATLNHQYRVLDQGQYQWRCTDEMQVGDKLVIALDTYHNMDDPELVVPRRHHHNEKELVLPGRLTPDVARFVGLFCADGSMHEKGIRIHCDATGRSRKQVEIAAMIVEQAIGMRPSGSEDNGRGELSLYYNSRTLLRWLYANELDKPHAAAMEIPYLIRIASRASLQAFVEGYWEGDGSVSSARYIDTASYKLASQLVVIHRALGSDATIQIHTSGFGSTMYRVNIIKTKSRCESFEETKILQDLGLDRCTLDTIRDIEDSKCMTLDISVPETQTYVANGVVSHNTIGIIGETTTSAEPVLFFAYKRRFLDTDGQWKYQYVIDPTMVRMAQRYGIEPDQIETAYTLAYDPEKRIKFQADLQRYVDHGISSTINLPEPITDQDWVRHYGDVFMKYLPYLRGFTCYPNGARAGQPFEPVPYAEAVDKTGVTYEEDRDVQCASGVCGI